MSSENVVEAARAELVAALKTVQGIRTYPEPMVAVAAPGLVVGIPALEWQTTCLDPTTARWPVYLVVQKDDRSASRLFEMLPRVTAALDGVRDAAVVRADPTTYPHDSGDLPAYLITVEYAL
jgi:hypothetical protein